MKIKNRKELIGFAIIFILLIIAYGVAILDFNTILIALASIAAVVYGYGTLYLNYVINPVHDELKSIKETVEKKIDTAISHTSKKIESTKEDDVLKILKVRKDRAEVFKGELIDEGITYKQGGLIFILTMIMSVFLVTLVFIVITNANSFKGTDAIITGGVISVLGLLTFLASILSSQVLLGIVRMHYFIIKEIQHTTDPEKILDGIIDYYK